MGDRHRRRPFGFLLLLVLAGVITATVQLTPSTWPLAVRLVLAVMGAIAAGAVGSYVSEWLAARRAVKAAEDAAIAEEEARRVALLATREVAATSESVAGLLRPERGAVAFVGRVEELKSLTDWCRDEVACPVWLLTGQGGVGKTRLALHLAESLPFMEWKHLQVRPGQEVAAVRAATQMSQRVLLLVDYAETRSELADMLAEVVRLETEGNADRLRVLLVARQAGEWWTELDAESDAVRDLVARTSMLELAPALDTERGDLQVVEEALPFFAVARGCSVPQVAINLNSGERLPVLVLHAVALVAVLDEEQGTVGGRAAADSGVLDRLLGHERRLWDKTARRAGVGVDLAVLQQVIAAVALLLDPQDHDGEAVRALVRRVPDLARADDARVGVVVRWLRQVYPGDGERVEALQPDLLAERHVVNQFIKSSELLRLCLADLTPSQTERALTLLARACNHQKEAQKMLARAVDASTPHRINQIISVALQGGTHVGRALYRSLQKKVLTYDELEHICNAIPSESSSLLEADRFVARKVISEHSDAMEINRKAYWYRILGALDLRASNLDDALTHTTIAFELYASETQSPSRDLMELSRIANNLGTVLSQKGRGDEGVNFLREAVKMRRRIVHLSGEFQAELAVSLINLSNELRPSEESLVLAREAVQLLEVSPKEHPGKYQSELAGAKVGLASRLADRGLQADALEQAKAAVAIYREIIADSPDIHQYNFASALLNQGNYLEEMGYRRDAIASIEEGVQLLKNISKTYPDRHDAALAHGLINYATSLGKIGSKNQDAISVMSEAIDICRKLINVDRVAHGGLFGHALVHMGLLMRRAGYYRESMASIAKGVDIYKDLARLGESEHIHIGLSRALLNLSSSQLACNDLTAALRSAEESLNILLTHRQGDHEVYIEEWAKCLVTLGSLLSLSGNQKRALSITVEAVTLYRELAAVNPGRHSPTLAYILAMLGQRYAQFNKYSEAVISSKEALSLFKALSTVSSEGHAGSIGSVLLDIGMQLSELGKPRDALNYELQAIEIYGELVKSDPSAYLVQYARALDNAGCSTAQMGDHREGLRYSRKAVRIARSMREIDEIAGDQILLQTLGNLLERLREFQLLDEMQSVSTEIAMLIQRLRGVSSRISQNLTLLD